MNFQFKISGMTCAACSSRVEKVVSEVNGVDKVEVNLLRGSMKIEADSGAVVEPVIRAIQGAGYGASLYGDKRKPEGNGEDSQKKMKSRLLTSWLFLLVLMYFTMGHMLNLPLPHWYHGTENAVVAALLQLTLTLPVVYLNRDYYIRGIKALRHRSPNMDSLIAIGSLAALIYGISALYRMAWAAGHNAWNIVEHYSENLYFESAAMILTLITQGKFLEARAKGKTGDAIKALMDLSPKTAVIRKNGLDREISIEEVQIGDTLVVRSGGCIPVDGIILEGRGAVDQSMLTGESVPVEKGPGDSVAAATINAEGFFLFRAEKIGEDTTLAQVIRLVEDAGGSKAPIARLADRIAGIFVPVVMTIAALAFLAWILVGQTLEFALSAGISVLVISCPCALGLATPVAIMVGTGRGASLGVLYKNAQALERLHKIDTVVLDKTGTLTNGKPAVTAIIPSQCDADSLLTMAGALEFKSEHPFARAILARCGERTLLQTEAFETLPGQGVSAILNGKRIYGGNARLMESIGVAVPEFAEKKERGETPLYFAAEGQYLGAILVADKLKPDSLAAVQSMQRMKLDVVMLTGDNEQTAATIAEQAGITHVIANVLPGDKVDAIRALQAKGRNVLMVGDGINDAPAMVTADVGMAIGSGTDIAIEAADIVLMRNSLSAVSAAIELSRATIQNIRQNLFWAFFYNTLGIPIAAGILYPALQVLLSPMLGAAAMSMSSVFVVTNALRLRGFRPRQLPQMEAAEKPTEIEEEIQMETVIKVEGMMCTHCKARVENVCKAVSGTTDAVVDLQAKQVTVTGTASHDALKQAIIAAGYEVID